MKSRSRSVRFENALHDRLAADGWRPARERFPLAGEELDKLGYRPLLREKAARSYIVAIRAGDGMVREQLRTLNDQFHNALVREKNELRSRPTLLRGICIFAFETLPAPLEVRILLARVRPRAPVTPIRAIPWVYDVSSGTLRRPWLTRSPIAARVLAECRTQALA